MLFNCIKKLIIKTISLTVCIYLVLSIFIVSQAESYEWSVINNTYSIETSGTIQSENNITSTDTLNLDCESAILIEQTTRSNIIRKKST